MSDLRKAAEMALKVLNIGANEVIPNNYEKTAEEAARRLNDALFDLSDVEWFDAPTTTEWGETMVCAAVTIDDNHYFDVYCERWQKENVELLLGIKKREWVGLTDEKEVWEMWVESPSDVLRFAKAIEAKLKEKNT